MGNWMAAEAPIEFAKCFTVPTRPAGLLASLETPFDTGPAWIGVFWTWSLFLFWNYSWDGA